MGRIVQKTEMDEKKQLLRSLPQIDELMRDGRMKETEEHMGTKQTADGLRRVIQEMRQEILDGTMREQPTVQLILERAEKYFSGRSPFSLRRVINGTGVILHTNLGRAVLSERAIKAVAKVSGSYSNLEYRIAEGKRGSRHDHVSAMVSRLCGAEDAMVVNNNAAAVLLVLSALARGKDVLISRGELIEIGGSFRIPDVMEQGGACLKEVGTTNRTRCADYERAVTEDTGLVLKVHTSNYRIIGFTEEATLGELATVAHKHNLPLVFDMGSGFLKNPAKFGITEPDAEHALQEGADLVLFSGDKLIGGAQAGLIVGKKAYVEQLKKHPLARALRVDKMTLAALEATLWAYQDDKTAEKEIPVLHMLTLPEEELTRRADLFCKQLQERFSENGLIFSAEPCEDCVGGGAMPEYPLPGMAVTIRGTSAGELEQALRQTVHPLVAVVRQDRLWISVRTLLAGDEQRIMEDLQEILRRAAEKIQNNPAGNKKRESGISCRIS